MKFDGFTLVSDIDGTLVDRDWNVTQQNIEAIQYFQSEGGKFTLATGRIPWHVKQLQQKLHIDLPIICYNGACIYDLDSGKTWWQHMLEGDVTNLVDDVLKNVKKVGLQIYSNHCIYMYGRNPEIANVTFLDDGKNVLDLKDYKETPQPWAKLMFVVRADKLRELRNRVQQHPDYSKYAFVQSSPEYYEMLHPLTNKGNALETLVQMNHLEREKIIAVGDNENDIEMVKRAKYGFMTDTAEENYKKVADFITGSCERDSIAGVVQRMEEFVL